MVTKGLHGRLDQAPCALARNIAEFESLGNDVNPFDYFLCPYSLGERVFRDLFRNMDETNFRLAFRRLYLHTLFEPANRCGINYNKWMCHVREAFTTYAPEESTATIEKVIARWHDGSEPYDQSHIDDTLVETQIAAINGRIEEAYLTFSTAGIPVYTINVGPNWDSILYMKLDYSYQHSSDLKNFPIEVAVSFEDGFEFRRREVHLPAPAEDTRRTTYVRMDEARALGRYWVHLYFGEQKIAEATFEVGPELDPYSIRGTVTGSDNQPLGRIKLQANRKGEIFRIEAGPVGAFDVIASSGTFILEVYLLVGTQWKFVGWHDVNGGVTLIAARPSRW